MEGGTSSKKRKHVSSYEPSNTAASFWLDKPKEDRLTALPELLQRMIARKVSAQRVDPHMWYYRSRSNHQSAGLRKTSKHWRQIYDSEVSSYTVEAEYLPEQLSYIMGLTALQELSICGSGFTVPKAMLDGISASLKQLELNGPEINPQFSSSGQLSRLIVEDFAKVLLSWCHSLEELVVFKCELQPSEKCALDTPGYFSKFLKLVTIQLVDIKCSSQRLPTVQVSGCVTLEKLTCSGNKFSTLDVTSCNFLRTLRCARNLLTTLDLGACCHLTHLDISDNHLTTIDLSACPLLSSLLCNNNSLDSLNVLSSVGLRQLECQENSLLCLDLSASTALEELCCGNNILDTLILPRPSCNTLTSLKCSGNKLITLDLSSFPSTRTLDCDQNMLVEIKLAPLAHIDKMRCVGNDGALVVAGGAVVLDLECDAGVFESLSTTVRAHLQRLVLHGPVTDKLTEFRDLKKLTCSIAPTSSINLTSCTKVKLTCDCMTDSLMIFGRENVKSLRLSGMLGLSDFIGFTALQSLAYDSDQLKALDLSMCSKLDSVNVQNSEGLRFAPLTSINVTGCSSLKYLVCNSCPGLLELDLSTCCSLEHLYCVGSGLRSLDVSMCPEMRSMSVSDSLLLATIDSTNCIKMEGGRMSSGHCPKLPSSNGCEWSHILLSQ